MGWKFVHGLANGVAGVLEVPGQIMKGHRKGETGMGIVKGFWYFLSREASAGECFMFLFPNPKDNCGYAWGEQWAWSAMSEDSAPMAKPAPAPAKK